MNINVNPESLDNMASYISAFSNKVRTECVQIEMATAKLAQTMDSESVQNIETMIHHITMTVDDAQPILKELQKKVEAYAAFVRRLKAIANG